MKANIFGTTVRIAPEPMCYAIVDSLSVNVADAIGVAERVVSDVQMEGILIPFNPAIDCGEHGGLRSRLDGLALSSDFRGALVVVPVVPRPCAEDVVDTLLRLRNELTGFEMPSFTIVRGPDVDSLSGIAAVCGFVPLVNPTPDYRADNGVTRDPVAAGRDTLPQSVREIVESVAVSTGDDLATVLANAETAMSRRPVRIGFAEGAS